MSVKSFYNVKKLLQIKSENNYLNAELLFFSLNPCEVLKINNIGKISIHSPMRTHIHANNREGWAKT